MTKTPPVSVMPQSESRAAHFDFLFSTILNNFLDGATRQIRDKSQATSAELVSMCANVACSPVDCCALIQLALKSIPLSVKEAFGRPPWSWQLVGNIKEATQKTFGSATGVYAYHLTNINEQDEQDFYVGQTTRSFAGRWAEHARCRKAMERPDKFPSMFYQNLKMTRPENINIFILADISNFQEDVVLHKVMAGILEAGFCVFFDSLLQVHSPGSHEFMPGIERGISFAHRRLVNSSLAILSSHCLDSPSRPSSMPAVPWSGMNSLFPLFQGILRRPWLEQEVDILLRLQEREKWPVLSQEELAKAGFKRSLQAISFKRRSLGLKDRWP